MVIGEVMNIMRLTTLCYIEKGPDEAMNRYNQK